MASSQLTNDNPLSSSQHQHQSLPPSFPHPSTFDFLPDLYNLISRLSLPQQQSTLPAPAPNGTSTGRKPTPPLPSTSSLSSPPVPRTTVPSSGPSGMANASSDPLQITKTTSRDSTSSISNVSQIDIKFLPSHLYTLRTRIQRARDVVSQLPDINCSIEDQERELRDLQGRIEGLKGRVGELGSIASRGA